MSSLRGYGATGLRDCGTAGLRDCGTTGLQGLRGCSALWSGPVPQQAHRQNGCPAGSA
ncbi:hypothetical protein SGM_5852 [Streptomyces griseoaurantiacus M045]|uniref:Uncharacterized protein n=1 Tax=Streptomyces griseoaurantiacus M045 TaxID=996637 RepID=F3NRT8_9ACTN|nr:hypothetical protein SGM_5852 [Streptomyces griseoaurantiacus M045]